MLQEKDRRYIGELIVDMMADLEPKTSRGSLFEYVRVRDEDVIVDVVIDSWGYKPGPPSARLSFTTNTRAEIRSSMKIMKAETGEWQIDGKKLRKKIFNAMALGHEANDRAAKRAQVETDFLESLTPLSDLGEIETGPPPGFSISFDRVYLKMEKGKKSYTLAGISLYETLINLTECDLKELVELLKELREKGRGENALPGTRGK